MHGRVTEFGPDGWGTIRSDFGEDFEFHCTAIEDGSRTIEVGAEAEFIVVPGRRGRWEASALSKGVRSPRHG